jgi:ABC-type phosphate transport system substrate-binding protein
MARRASHLVSLPLAAVLALALAGCGVGIGGQAQKSAQATSATKAPAPAPVRPVEPQTPPGEVLVDGTSPISLTPLAKQDYEDSGGTYAINLLEDSSAQSYAKLCQGQVDIVDSVQVASPKEQALCKRNGVHLVQFQVASQGLVVATKAQVDIGADCISMHELYEMYRGGSPLYSWAQLGFDQVPLQVTGPSPGDLVFDAFDAQVMGSPTPSLLDFSSSYVAQPDAMHERLYVVGTPAQSESAARVPQEQATVGNLANYLHGAEATLEGGQETLSSAAFQVTKGRHDRRPLATQEADARTLAHARTTYRHDREAVSRLRAEHASALAVLHASEHAAQEISDTTGRAGFFSFSYYGLFEEQLRPLEITQSESPQNCIFPSVTTISNGSYPLAQQLLLTTSTRELQRPEVHAFLSSYLSNASSLAESQQLVPLPTGILAKERADLGSTQGADG